jgi:hypothetical protein
MIERARWAALPLLMLVLSGCGNLLSGLIPDSEVDNPLQFDGASIEVALGSGATLRRQAIGGSGSLDEAIAFGDQDLGPNALSPALLAIDGGFAGEAVLVADAYPNQLVLDDIELSLRLWQGAESFDDAGSDDRLAPDPIVAGSSLTLTKVDTGCSASCLYAFAFPSVASSSLQIELDGSDLDRALEIIRESPDANFVDVSLTLTIASDPELGPGGTLTLTLDAADGTLAF